MVPDTWFHPLLDNAFGGWNDTTVYISSFIHCYMFWTRKEWLFLTLFVRYLAMRVAKKRSKKWWLRPTGMVFSWWWTHWIFRPPKIGDIARLGTRNPRNRTLARCVWEGGLPTSYWPTFYYTIQLGDALFFRTSQCWNFAGKIDTTWKLVGGFRGLIPAHQWTHIIAHKNTIIKDYGWFLSKFPEINLLVWCSTHFH